MTIAKVFKTLTRVLLTMPPQSSKIADNENNIWHGVILGSDADLILPPHTDNSIIFSVRMVLNRRLRTSRYQYTPSHKDI